MADMTQIGVTGLLTSKSSLSTVSHNIVNANTEGYSRQRVDVEAIDPVRLGGNYLGQGAVVTGISRLSNQFLVDQLRRDTQNYNAYDSYYEFAVRMDSLLGDDATAITPTLQSFFNSVQDLNNDPTSVPVRQVVLSEANALTNRFNTIYDQVYQQNEALNTALVTVASQVTEISAGLADLNRSIAMATSNSVGELPNDLLDKRDQALRDLSALVGISVITKANNTVDVSIGTGQPLVIGDDSYTLRAISNVNGVNRYDLQLESRNSTVNVTEQVSGGKLGGLLNVRQELIDPVFNELGRLSMVIADTFNEQHRLGMDSNSNLGNDFFSDINGAASMSSRVSPNSDNAGDAAISVTIDDVSALKAVDYKLFYDGTNLTMTNRSTNQVISVFPDPGAAGTVSLPNEGITLNFDSGTLAAGDEFLVTPTRLYSSQVGVRISSVDQIAAAFPVRTTMPLANTGRGYVERVEMTETTDPVTGAAFTGARSVPPVLELQPPYQVLFTTATDYDVYDVSGLSAVPPTGSVLVSSGSIIPNQSNRLLAGAGITDTGYDVVFNGVPVEGDIVNIEYNGGGTADNRNVTLLGALRTAKTITGNASYQEAYGQLVSGVGTRTRDASIGQEASQSIMRQTESQRDSVSGVNLDEEAADLIKFQQSYQATARIIQVSQQLFDAIIGVL